MSKPTDQFSILMTCSYTPASSMFCGIFYQGVVVYLVISSHIKLIKHTVDRHSTLSEIEFKVFKKTTVSLFLNL